MFSRAFPSHRVLSLTSIALDRNVCGVSQNDRTTLNYGPINDISFLTGKLNVCANGILIN